MIKDAIDLISSGKDLTEAMMREVMEEIMEGKTDTAQIAAFLSSLSAKGESIDEVTAAVAVMRGHAIKINTSYASVLDTCGTGGDALGTFNISTTVALVAGGCGVAVAKHGNRCVSSTCGSADILEALGVNISMSVQQMEKCLNDIGITFLFAQALHPAMKYAMPARKQLGKKTIFNILGPLSNPAGATHQLIGVYDRRWAEILAKVLQNLGSSHALVVHGNDGLDEITTTAATFIAETHKGSLKTYEIKPEDFGFKRAEPSDLKGGDVSLNAKIILEILDGCPGPKRDIVVLNAAAALFAADKTASIKEGIALAEKSIDSKKALEKLNLLREFSKKA